MCCSLLQSVAVGCSRLQSVVEWQQRLVVPIVGRFLFAQMAHSFWAHFWKLTSAIVRHSLRTDLDSGLGGGGWSGRQQRLCGNGALETRQDCIFTRLHLHKTASSQDRTHQILTRQNIDKTGHTGSFGMESLIKKGLLLQRRAGMSSII